jgi:hypothetical protein
MAFNPFHAFRKHQKVVFAILTIICMLTFVLSSGLSGKGDAFYEIAHFFGGKGRIPDVATVFGNRIDAQHIQVLRQQREVANQFMGTAVGVAIQKVMLDVPKAVPEFEQYRNEFQQFDFSRQLMRLYGAGFFPQYDQANRLFQRHLEVLGDKLATARKTSEGKQIQLLHAALERERQLFQARDPLYPHSILYFGGSTNVEGLIDFMIWQHEADRLGIVLNPDDIKKAVRNETLDQLTSEDTTAIQRTMRLDYRSSSQSLLTALGEEFRVRLAQSALTGFDLTGITEVPAQVTPRELWDYYLRNRTEVNLTLLAIPGSRFIAQTPKPSEEDLKALYDTYKDVEFAPHKETPGFMRPRQIKVEWAEVSPDSEFYRRQARNLLLSQVTMLVGRPTLGPVLDMTVPFIQEFASAKYEPYWDYVRVAPANDPSYSPPLFTYTALQLPPASRADFALSMYTFTSLRRPATVASTVGLAAPGSFSLFASLFTIPNRAVAMESQNLAGAVAREATRRTPLSAAVFAFSNGVAAPLAASAPLLYAEKVEEFLPLEVAKAEVVRKLEERISKSLAKSDLASFKEELDKEKKDAEKKRTGGDKVVEAFIKKEITRRHWPHAETAAVYSRYDIGKAPELKPMREAYIKVHSSDEGPKDKRFGDLFFADVKADPAKLFVPAEFVQGDNTYVYWRSADRPPETQPFDRVRDQVEAAWRREKARPLAQAEAERVAQEARKSKDPIPVLTEAAKGQSLIEMLGVARLTRMLSPRAEYTGTYQPYVDRTEKIEFPPPDFVDKVLELTQVGKVTVLADQPKNTYYVAALTGRSEPTRQESQEAKLLPMLVQERRTVYRREIIEQLRAQAQVHIDTEGSKQVEERSRSRSPLEDQTGD